MKYLSATIYCVCLLMAYECAYAKTYYLDNVLGNNLNDGSSGKPWRSMRYSMGVLTAGDKLFVVDNGPTVPYRENITVKASGTRAKPITILAVDAKNKPSFVGIRDWSDIDAGGTKQWTAKTGGLVALQGVELPAALWVTTTGAWKDTGIAALRLLQYGSAKAELVPGQWLYRNDDKTLIYKPYAGEKLENLHIEAVIDKVLLKNYDHKYVTYKNIKFAFSAKTAVHVQKNSNHILLDGIEVQHAIQNGMAVKGGEYIAINDCLIDDARNNGIVFAGSKSNRLSHTRISGCKISHVSNNDCITLHKNMKQDDIGSGHLIESNVLSSCAEQGIDVTSGSDVALVNNITYGNGDSGIVIGHWVERVTVKNHLSVDDGRYAGILVNRAKYVSIKNSCILNSVHHQLSLRNAKGAVIEGNVIYQGKINKGSLVDIADKSSDLRFVNNDIVSESASGELLLRYLQKNDPEISGVYFSGNTWAAKNGGMGRQFYTSKYGKHTFINHNKYYNRNLKDDYIRGLRIADLKPLLVKNNCDLDRIPEQHKNW